MSWPYLSKSSYCKETGFSDSKVTKMLEDGTLPHFQTTKKYYIPATIIDAMELNEARKKIVGNECIVVSIGNHKGGVLKTTNTQNLSASLAFNGNKVLLVDTDPQSNATKGFGIFQKGSDINNPEQGYDLIKNNSIQLMLNIKENLSDEEFEQHIHNTIINVKNESINGKLDILPNDPKMINKVKELDEIANTETSLDYILSFVKKDYDYIIIDTPPRTDTLLRTSLMASDYFIISLKPDPYSSIGVPDVFIPIKSISRSYRMMKKKDLYVVGGIVGDMGTSNLHKTIVKTDKKNIEDLTKGTASTFETIIPHVEVVGESQLGSGAMIFSDFKHNTTKIYLSLTNEIVTKILEFELARKR